MFIGRRRLRPAADRASLVPTEAALPAEPFEPDEALRDTGDVEHRRDALNAHGGFPPGRLAERSMDSSGCAADVPDQAAPEALPWPSGALERTRRGDYY